MMSPSRLVGGDYLNRLLDSAAGAAPVVEPRRPSRFEPEQGARADFVERGTPDPFEDAVAEGSSFHATGLPVPRSRPAEPHPAPREKALDVPSEPRGGPASAPRAGERDPLAASRAAGAPLRGLVGDSPVRSPALAPAPSPGVDSAAARALGATSALVPPSPARPGPLADPLQSPLAALASPTRREPSGAVETAHPDVRRASGPLPPSAPEPRGPREAFSPPSPDGALRPSPALPPLHAAPQGALPLFRARHAAPMSRTSVDPEPVVHITIGRLEVRASREAGKPARVEQSGPRPMSLEDYLRARAGAR